MLLIILAFIFGGIYVHEERKNVDIYTYAYLDLPSTNGFRMWIEKFGSYFLLLNSLVPIDYIVAIDVVKIVALFFFENDVEMCEIDYEMNELRFCKVQNISKHDDLGWIN